MYLANRDRCHDCVHDFMCFLFVIFETKLLIKKDLAYGEKDNSLVYKAVVKLLNSVVAYGHIQIYAIYFNLQVISLLCLPFL